jgi:hypothetical protein
LFKTVCQIRRDEVDDAGTYELVLVHHIRGKGAPNELGLGSFTRRELKQLPIWDLWLALNGNNLTLIRSKKSSASLLS